MENDKITPPGGVPGRFGETVSISGNYALVGAPTFSGGSAIVYERSGLDWIRQTIMKAPVKDGDNSFGSSVSISGDYALVGAPSDNDNGASSGAAYIFVRSGNQWLQEAKIKASDGDQYDRFGESVSLSGDYAIVGASRNNDLGSASGSAYIFVRSGTSWNQQAKLLASDGVNGDEFGFSVAISGEFVVIGSAQNDPDGSVYFFK